MKVDVSGETYEVVIEKKIHNKNTYIRVKNDLKIYVTTNTLTSLKAIKSLIYENIDRIEQMIENQKIKKENNEGFFYLGKHYDIVYADWCNIKLGEDKVFINKNFDIDKWYKKQAEELFADHLDDLYNKFTKKIPYPKLRIRKMKTRWGVCNIRTKVITLNLELIKRDTKYLDYVIVHELSHLIHGDHSAAFWRLVEENMPDYKLYRKEMKDF